METMRNPWINTRVERGEGPSCARPLSFSSWTPLILVDLLLPRGRVPENSQNPSLEFCWSPARLEVLRLLLLYLLLLGWGAWERAMSSAAPEAPP